MSCWLQGNLALHLPSDRKQQQIKTTRRSRISSSLTQRGQRSRRPTNTERLTSENTTNTQSTLSLGGFQLNLHQRFRSTGTRRDLTFDLHSLTTNTFISVKTLILTFQELLKSVIKCCLLLWSMELRWDSLFYLTVSFSPLEGWSTFTPQIWSFLVSMTTMSRGANELCVEDKNHQNI